MYGFDPYIRTMYGPDIPYNPYIVATLNNLKGHFKLLKHYLLNNKYIYTPINFFFKKIIIGINKTIVKQVINLLINFSLIS